MEDYRRTNCPCWQLEYGLITECENCPNTSDDDIDDILPSECEECGYRLSAIENTPKEITINYLESIKKEKQNILYNFKFSLALLNDVKKIDRVIEIVKESEGE